MNAPRIPRLPYGADQQGRYPGAAWPYEPTADGAHAATDVGADDDDERRDDPMAPARGILLAIAITAAGVIVGQLLSAFWSIP